MDLKIFKESSKLEIIRPEGPPLTYLSSTARGDIFVRDGALCMRLELNTEVSYGNKRACDTQTTPGYYYIVNLQTGRAWPCEECLIYFVRATCTIVTE